MQKCRTYTWDHRQYLDAPAGSAGYSVRHVHFALPDGTDMETARAAILEMLRPATDLRLASLGHLLALKPVWNMDEASARVHLRHIHGVLVQYPDFVYAEVLADALDHEGKNLPAVSLFKRWADEKVKSLALLQDYFLDNPSETTEPFHAD